MEAGALGKPGEARSPRLRQSSLRLPSSSEGFHKAPQCLLLGLDCWGMLSKALDPPGTLLRSMGKPWEVESKGTRLSSRAIFYIKFPDGTSSLGIFTSVADSSANLSN